MERVDPRRRQPASPAVDRAGAGPDYSCTQYGNQYRLDIRFYPYNNAS